MGNNRTSTFNIRAAGTFCLVAVLLVPVLFAQEPKKGGEQPEPKYESPGLNPNQPPVVEPGLIDPATPAVPSKEDPAKVEERKVRLEKNLPWFEAVLDDGEFRQTTEFVGLEQVALARQEARAFDYTVVYASSRDQELMKKYAYRDVRFSDLFTNARFDYLRELLHFEGELFMVLRVGAPDGVKADLNTEWLYQAWIKPKGFNEYLTLIVTELPEGIELGKEDLRKKVSFDGYFFKFSHQKFQTKKGNDPAKVKRVPMLIGKTFDIFPEAPPAKPSIWPAMTVIGFVIGLLLLVIGLTIWFRRSDREVKQSLPQPVIDQELFRDELDGNGDGGMK
ncbi:MAG: hypothetical protein R3B84_21105 [Zavarzinella sp.]